MRDLPTCVKYGHPEGKALESRNLLELFPENLVYVRLCLSCVRRTKRVSAPCCTLYETDLGIGSHVMAILLSSCGMSPSGDRKSLYMISSKAWSPCPQRGLRFGCSAIFRISCTVLVPKLSWQAQGDDRKVCTASKSRELDKEQDVRQSNFLTEGSALTSFRAISHTMQYTKH